MAKSTEEYRSQLMDYYTLFDTYEEMNDNPEKEKPVFAEKGDLFVLPYCFLREVIREDYHDYTLSRNDGLIGPELENLSTVVEYAGNGLFKDLITGLVFNTEVFIDDVLDLVTDDYEVEAANEWAKNIEHPLAIYSSNEFNETIPYLLELDHTRKLDIMKNTLANRDDVIEKLEESEEKARKRVDMLYEKINKKAEERNADNKLVADFDKIFDVDGYRRK